MGTNDRFPQFIAINRKHHKRTVIPWQGWHFERFSHFVPVRRRPLWLLFPSTGPSGKVVGRNASYPIPQDRKLVVAGLGPNAT